MTRAEMVTWVKTAQGELRVASEFLSNPSKSDLLKIAAGCEAAAAELRKTCATCCWFRVEQWHIAATAKTKEMGGVDSDCHAWDSDGTHVPEDGSGFCHRWESQPAGQAQD